MSEQNYINILIIGDSRMRSMENELNKFTLSLKFSVKFLPGAKLHQLTLKALTSLSYPNSFQLVIIAGGINDMTRLVHIPSRHALPKYGNAEALAEAVLYEMRTSVRRIKEITDIPVVMATLPGMDLAGYSPEFRDLLISLQPCMDNAITTINKQVRGINRLNNIHSLNLAYPVHRCKGKRGYYRNQYSLLVDGLHPGEYLMSIWANALVSYCTRIFPEVTHLQGTTTYYYQY